MTNTFGEFLKTKRQEKKLTQKELAKLLIVSESAVSKWEKDVAHPDITLLPKLSEILGVTEHELITASVDNKSREEKKQAKKWRTLSFSWSMFFYISYAITILTCFICNLAVSKTLSWFWIVVSSLLLAFTFTNLPKLIKKHKLLILPLSMYGALCLLLGVCAIYTKGSWFFIASLSVLLGLTIIFAPIYICKYKVFNSVKKYADFVSIAVDFVILNILLVVINGHALRFGFATTWWYLKLAFPIAGIVYLILNLLLYVRFLKVNRFLKTTIILALINLMVYGILPFVKINDADFQKVIDGFNVYKANFSNWSGGVVLERNINLIICLTLVLLIVVFGIIGLLRQLRKNKK
ncbi:MAG: helix-turn-helix domain-containing protein [Clostridiales bacterium]|nr:helix-turn-helix domain-containing protein [Clostridiales bacterium]